MKLLMLIIVLILPLLDGCTDMPDGLKTALEDGDTNASTLLDSFTNRFGMTFYLMPAGTFFMGSPEGEPGRKEHENRHTMVLTQAFYMQSTEVTQGQWMEIMETTTNPSRFVSCGPDCPVEQVSWLDVQEFITRLNRFGEGTYYLPTEAQWEYAARGGTDSAFFNGEITAGNPSLCEYDRNLDSVGWYCENAVSTDSDCFRSADSICRGTHPVASKPPNDFGLFDMHGNVWEWCSDWFAYYPPTPEPDYGGPTAGEYKIIRGGSWYNPAADSRSANRDLIEIDRKEIDVGFRLVCLPSSR